MADVNHSATLSIGARVAGSYAQSVGAVVGGTSKIKKAIAGLKEDQRGIADSLRKVESAAASMGISASADVAKLSRAHKALTGEQAAVEKMLKRAQDAAAKLGKSGSEDIDRLLDKTEQLAHQEKHLVKQLDEARKAAARLGVEGSADVAKLRGEHERLGRVLDRQGSRLRNAQSWAKLDVGGRTFGALKQLGSNLAEVGRYAAYAGAAMGGAALAGVTWFTKSALEATSSMETLQTALSTVTGGDANAKKALSWITDFAATTPYELGQVGEAFQRLKAYGIDPTNGTLRVLGDTASSMGKPLMSAVEAIADAVTGENERLKEFGIRATKAGNQITYFYKNAAGEDVKKRVNRNSQEMIRATLMSIWNEKYAGSMEKQSRTWAGLVSNLSDHWTQFQVRVMQGGVFDLLKGELEGALAQVNQWAADGTLERWAGEISSAYRWAFGQVREGFAWLRENWPEIKKGFVEGATAAKEVATWIYKIGKWASDAVGGPGNLAKGLLVLGAAKTLAPLASLASVGWDIVAWLSRATGLTGALSSGLGKVGQGLGGAVKSGGSMAGGGLSAAGSKVGGALTAGRVALNAGGAALGLGGTVAAASGAAVAGTVAAGAALGVAVGMGINAATEALTGKDLSTRLGDWAYESVNGLKGGAPGSSIVDNRTVNRSVVVNVDAKGADADEVARKVAESLNMSMRGEELASYGG